MTFNLSEEDDDMIFWSREPTLTQILSDPITKAVMQADSVDAGELDSLLRDVASRLDARSEQPQANARRHRLIDFVCNES